MAYPRFSGNLEPSFPYTVEYNSIKDWPRSLDVFCSTSSKEDPYLQKETRFFGTIDGIEGHYELITFSALNKGVLRVAMACIFRILLAEKESIITYQTKREMVQTLFSTNSPLSNFAFMQGHYSDAPQFRFCNRGSCVEREVIGNNKTRVTEYFLQKEGPEECFKTLTTSKFVSSKFLETLLKEAVRYPAPTEDLSKEQLALYDKEKLEYYRKELAKVEKQTLLERTVLEIRKNYLLEQQIDPSEIQKAGRTLPMSPACQAFWNKISGLAFVAGTLHAYSGSLLNAAVSALLLGYKEEVTAGCGKYGFAFENEKLGLDNILTETGIVEWQEKSKVRMEKQRVYLDTLINHLHIARASANAFEVDLNETLALTLLTDALASYSGSMGLIKRIADGISTEQLVFTDGLLKKISNLLEEGGLKLDFNDFYRLVAAPDMERTYDSIKRIGLTQKTYEDYMQSA